MAKKSQSGRGKPMPQQAKGAAHKPQAPERASTATLVRAPGSAPSETPSASNIVAETTPVAPARQPAARPAPSARPTERKATVAERSALPKPATPQPATPQPVAPQPAASAAPAARKPAPTPTREQNQRLVRARATQRARQANLISAEHYSYVLGDLKLVLALAISALVVLIALTFVLPH
jgi:hypothetical protein